MTATSDNEESFAPLSDLDLAAILEAQLAQIRGSTVPPVSPPAWINELFDVPTEEMSAAQIVAVAIEAEPQVEVVAAVEVAPIAPAPMMFSAAEMRRLMGGTAPTPTSLTAVAPAAVLHSPTRSTSNVEQPAEPEPITKRRDVSRPSFDDLLFGSAPDE